MNFFQRHMTLKGHIVLFLGAFFTGGSSARMPPKTV